MSSSRVLPLGLLLAASSLSAQVIISGAGGLANETYSTAIDTTGGNTLSLAFMIDYLVVGGGGAGGTAGGSGGENTWGAGGGGAGGVLSGSTNLSATSYTVSVGAGGTAANYSAGSTTNGGSGTKSVFGSIEALGGGGGAGSNNAANGGGVGLSGGSGGGGGGDGLKAGGAGTLGQGFGGGTSRSSAGNRAAGGGGGGAGGVGEIGGPPNGHNSGVGGKGGVGVSSNISGSSVFYGGGGGGGGRDTNGGATSAGGTGGSGGGGAGSGAGAATSGTDGLGGGGGGSGADGKGGDGGDGIVIVRYKGASIGSGTGGTIASGTGTSAGYTLHTFSTVGSSSLNLSSVNLDTRLGSVVSSDISGAGALTINTQGTIRYTGTATHTGGTVLSDGYLQLGNGGTGGSLGGAISVASGASLEYNRSGDANFSSLSGAGEIIKKGASRLAISGSGGHTGKVTLSAGTLALGDSSALGAGTLDVAAGTTLSSDSSNARSLARDINFLGNASLGSATDTGVLTVSGAVDLGGNRTLTVASDVTLSGVVSNGHLWKAGAGKLTLSAANTYNGTTGVQVGTLVIDGSISSSSFYVASGATIQVGSSGTSGSLGAGHVILQSNAQLVFDRSDDIVIGNAIHGSIDANLQTGEVVKKGAGKLTFTNPSTFGGRYVVQEGEVVVNRGTSEASNFVWANISEGATYTAINNYPDNGRYHWATMSTSGAGQLVLKGTSRTNAYTSALFPSGLTHTGGTVIDGASLLQNGMLNALAPGSSLTIRGGGLLGGGAYSLGSVTIEDGFLYPSNLGATSLEVHKGEFYGYLLDATPLLKVGSGEFRLASNGWYHTGTNRIEGGVLTTLTYNSLGQGATTVAGGSLRFRHGADSTAEMTTLVLDGGAVEVDVAINGTRKLNAEVLDLRSGTIEVSLVGKGVLTKTTAGTVTLEADNSSFAGNVTVSEGLLRLLTTTSLGTTSTVLLEGGTIELAGTTRVGYFEQTGGSVTGGTLVSSLILTESGTLGSILADDVGGASGILKRTSGTTQVTAANTFTGGINIQQGTLQLAGAGAFNAASRVITSSGASLHLGGKSQSLSGIEGEGTIELGTGGALTVASSTADSTFSGVISGDGTLTKNGSNSLTLSGSNTYTGGTSVLGGTLVVNGSLASSTLGVASGATLGGSGTIVGDTTISGTHTPGNSPGIQNFGNLTYTTGSILVWELAASTTLNSPLAYDQIFATGTLDFAGATYLNLVFNWSGGTVDWNDTFWSADQSWQIFFGNTITGFGNLTLSTNNWQDINGLGFDQALAGAAFSLSQSGQYIYLNYTAAIPEPSTYGLILGGLALAGAAIRRRKQAK